MVTHIGYCRILKTVHGTQYKPVVVGQFNFRITAERLLLCHLLFYKYGMWYQVKKLRYLYAHTCIKGITQRYLTVGALFGKRVFRARKVAHANPAKKIGIA